MSAGASFFTFCVTSAAVGGKQFAEIPHLVQPLLVVLHTCFHQESREPVLHLHHLPHHQMPIPQGAAAI
jgi:hypothetical protein